MRINEILSNEMYRAIEGAKSVSRVAFTSEQLLTYTSTINAINALPYGQEMLGNYPLSKYEIPTFMKDCIVPDRIQFVNSIQHTDFKYGYALEEGQTDTFLSPFDFNDMSNSILAARRMNSGGLTDVSTLRASQTLTTLKDSTVLYGDDMKCFESAALYFPVTVSIDIYRERYCFTTAHDMAIEWFREAFKTVNK